MSISSEEIKRRLAPFAARWSVYGGSERAEAQTFLNELFGCYGTSRGEVAAFEEPRSGRFVDLHWPGTCIIEMKAPSEAGRLPRHREQALRYWRESSDLGAGIPAARYVVLCAFRRLEVWEPGRFPEAPQVEMDLIDLPERYDALLFLAGREPVFSGHEEDVSREAVAKVTEVYRLLEHRGASDADVLRDFLLQSVWCMFAEDLGLLDAHLFTRLVHGLLDEPERSSADDLGGLFTHLNDPSPTRPQYGLYRDVPYANGGLFAQPARVHLERVELDLLREACEFNWRLVQPQIFGSLLEGALGREKQWALGAHYTHEADIQKIVQPTIVRPWTERIENVSTHAQVVDAQNDLMRYVVLDPACGSGNFLYVAYRELRRIEARLRDLEAELRTRAGMRGQESLSFFPIGNVRGIEIDPFAVSLARVTLWMGHKLAADELGVSEATLPLADLSGIRQGDALRLDWPRADAVIGNPPYHGSQLLRRELGNSYVEWLCTAFGVGVQDLCVYWFRRAHDHLAPGGRAGLVGTNSVSQNRARRASLDYIVERGGVITDAVSRQPWPGVAVVNVSIVNWVRDDADGSRPMLDGVEVPAISTSLRRGEQIEAAERLPGNAKVSFQGPIPVGEGFVLGGSEAALLLTLGDADYTDVVRPYLTGDDIADDPRQAPRRYVIDFATRTLEEATRYPAALDIVRERVKPGRDVNRRKARRERWWLFGEAAVGMRRALAPLGRYIAGTAQGKRFFFSWQEPRVCPSNLTNVFAFDSDWAMGVLCSTIHLSWALHQSSTLRTDPRYTTTSAFATFAWPPDPRDADREAVAEACRLLIARRSEICRREAIGLTTLYNRMDDGAWTDLRDLHRALDAAVARAYGWPVSIARAPDETNRRLLDLNRRIVAGKVSYEPFRGLRDG